MRRPSPSNHELLELLRWCVKALGRDLLAQYPEGRRALEMVEVDAAHGQSRNHNERSDR